MGESLGKSTMLEKVTHFLTKHCEQCIREFYMLVLIEESCQTRIA